MAEFQGLQDDSQTSNLECEFSRFSGPPRRNGRTAGAPWPAYGTYSVRNTHEEIPPPNSNPFTNSGVKVAPSGQAIFFSAIVYIYDDIQYGAKVLAHLTWYPARNGQGLSGPGFLVYHPHMLPPCSPYHSPSPSPPPSMRARTLCLDRE